MNSPAEEKNKDMENQDKRFGIKLQKGVLRTNCVDCLDRTNIGQMCISLLALKNQLMEISDHLTSVQIHLKQTIPQNKQKKEDSNKNLMNRSYEPYKKKTSHKARFSFIENFSYKKFKNKRKGSLINLEEKKDSKLTLFSGDRLTRIAPMSLKKAVKKSVQNKKNIKKGNVKKNKQFIFKKEDQISKMNFPLSIQEGVFKIWEELGDCLAFLYTGSKAHNLKKQDKIKTVLIRYYKNNFSDYNRQKILDRLMNNQVADEANCKFRLVPILKNIMIRDETLLRITFNFISNFNEKLKQFKTNKKNYFLFSAQLIKEHKNFSIINKSKYSIQEENEYIKKKFKQLDDCTLNSDKNTLRKLVNEEHNKKDQDEFDAHTKRNIPAEVHNYEMTVKTKRKNKNSKVISKFIYENDFFEPIKFSNPFEKMAKKNIVRSIPFINDQYCQGNQYKNSIVLDNKTPPNDLFLENYQFISGKNSTIISDDTSYLSINRALSTLGIENDSFTIKNFKPY